MTYARDARVRELAATFGGDQAEQNAAIVATDEKAEAAKDDWSPLGSVRAARHGGIVPAATAYPGEAIDLEAQQWDDDAATGYLNIYGASKYRKALHKRVQVTGADANPLLVYQKFSTADRSVDAAAWDQGGYFGIHSTAGDAYRAALTGAARAMLGASGDHIGVHARADARDPGARGYALWAYAADQTDGGSATAMHAAEVNGFCLTDPGYGSSHELIRLCMADSAATANRFGSAVTIGKSTHGGDNGFHTGVHIEADAIIRTAVDDGEAFRIDAPTSASGSIGGIRYANPSGLGVFKYALRTNEAAFSSNIAVLLGTGQHVRWGTSAAGVNLTGGASSLALGNALLNIANPVGGAAIQVSGTKVLGAQGAAVADATDAASVIAQLNALLSRLRAHGLIAT